METSPNRNVMTGMTAAAYAAYALSDAAMIFPITPASHMAETIESWAVAEKKNLFGQTVDVQEMQSEKGASGAMHGCLSGGALTSTFTASQGLMLMIPNMYKISGEMLPGVFHITGRSLAAHALSIFGDHQDIMAVRATGVAMLASTSVQECMDLSLVAHLSAIQGSLPFAHFFDGFRTSDELATIDVIEQEQMRDLVDWDAVARFRKSCMEPERPLVRGTAQNSDVYFQYREAPNVYYDALPGIVQENMDKVAKLTGRTYHLFDYYGAPDAERVIVSLASSCDVVTKAVDYLNARGEKVGLIKVRLYRPFSMEHFVSAIPASTKIISVLDRTKEPGSQGEPLLQDVCTAILSSGKSDIRVVGGRYGLSSKDFTPAMACAVYDNMKAADPKTRFTVGITDDVTNLSLPIGEPIDIVPKGMVQCMFYGFGSDGTVGANKEATKIVGNYSGKYAQGYSWFDSKKSGGLTISYLRFGDEPINAPYLITQADYIACHKDIYVTREYPMADALKEGGVFVLNSSWDLDAMEKHFPAAFKRSLAEKHARLYVIDAAHIAEEVGLGTRINMIMETAFFKLSQVMDFDQAIALLKEDIKTLYAAKGQEVIAMNLKAIDAALTGLQEVTYPQSWINAKDTVVPTEVVPEFVADIARPMDTLHGDELPVSKFNPAGFVPLGSSGYEKRSVAFSIPEWQCDKCIQCYQCSFVCPHGAIRPYVATDSELSGAPQAYNTKPATLKEIKGLHFRIQVYPQDCVGCGSCAHNCPAPGKALVMKPLETQLETQKENLRFAQENVSLKDDLVPKTTVPGTQLQQPLLQFSGACAGCGETPYVKLLTQLFGDRLLIANATGCSSIWGAYMPSISYTTNKRGHGPAWGNSLFEDNGEYGFGIAKGVRIRRNKLVALVTDALADPALPADLKDLMQTWLEQRDDADAAYDIGQAIQTYIVEHNLQNNTDKKSAAASYTPSNSAAPSADYEQIMAYAEMFGKKSVWAVGGDGWAYDIDYDGIDHVLAQGENINILVLDTEGYSNTGGELSKATQLGSVSGFALDGKPTPKKNMGRMMMAYDYVYVAQVCLGADMQQTITALREAEAYDGPSIVICLCPCISWGLKEGMSTVVSAQKQAVKAGYWPLFRFNPMLAAKGKDPLTIDYKTPDGKLEEFLDGQNRYTSLKDRKPTLSARLQSELAKDCDRNYEELVRTVDVYKPASTE